MFNVIKFHDETKELTQEGKRKCNDDLLEPLTIKYQKWDDKYPTFYNEQYKDVSYKEINSEDVVNLFFNSFPIFNQINMENILIAGGSLAIMIQYLSIDKNFNENDPLLPQNIPDIDLFIYGLNIEQATDKLHHIAETFGMFNENGVIQKSSNAVSFISNQLKIQVILRIYDTTAQILHGFDLGSSMVGISNKTLVMTSFGLYCIKNRINVVVTKYSSTTYELRLLKYLSRGYNIVMRYLDFSKLEDGNNELKTIDLFIGEDLPEPEEILDYEYNKGVFRLNGKDEKEGGLKILNFFDKIKVSSDYDLNNGKKSTVEIYMDKLKYIYDTYYRDGVLEEIKQTKIEEMIEQKEKNNGKFTDKTLQEMEEKIIPTKSKSLEEQIFGKLVEKNYEQLLEDKFDEMRQREFQKIEQRIAEEKRRQRKFQIEQTEIGEERLKKQAIEDIKGELKKQAIEELNKDLVNNEKRKAIQQPALNYTINRYLQTKNIYISILYINKESLKTLIYATDLEPNKSIDFDIAYRQNAPIKWKTENPGSQLCGSFNPLNITEKQWYGDFYTDIKTTEEQKEEEETNAPPPKPLSSLAKPKSPQFVGVKGNILSQVREESKKPLVSQDNPKYSSFSSKSQSSSSEKGDPGDIISSGSIQMAPSYPYYLNQKRELTQYYNGYFIQSSVVEIM